MTLDYSVIAANKEQHHIKKCVLAQLHFSGGKASNQFHTGKTKSKHCHRINTQH